MSSRDQIICFKGGKILRKGELEDDDIWVRGGRIIDPQHLFFRERRAPDFYFDCSNLLVAPGFIDIQINGPIHFISSH